MKKITILIERKYVDVYRAKLQNRVGALEIPRAVGVFRRDKYFRPMPLRFRQHEQRAEIKSRATFFHLLDAS